MTVDPITDAFAKGIVQDRLVDAAKFLSIGGDRFFPVTHVDEVCLPAAYDPGDPDRKCIGMAQPAAEKDCLATDHKPDRILGGLSNPLGELCAKFWSQHLVGIEHECPGMPECPAIKCPIALLGEALEGVAEHARSETVGNLTSIVGRTAVHDDNVVKGRQGSQTAPNVVGLVLRQDDNGNIQASAFVDCEIQFWGLLVGLSRKTAIR